MSLSDEVVLNFCGIVSAKCRLKRLIDQSCVLSVFRISYKLHSDTLSYLYRLTKI